MPKRELIDLPYDRLVHETEKAWLFNFGGKEVWLPKSLAELDPDEHVVIIPYNWAYDKGLI